MVVFKTRAEIRSAFHDETINMQARTVNGVLMPSKTWRKRYYHCEINDTPAMLRFRDEVIVNAEFKKGTFVEVSFGKVEIESDVSQVHCIEIVQCK